MCNLFGFIVIFLGLVLFLPNNFISTIMIFISVFAFLSFSIIYIFARKKEVGYKEEIKLDKVTLISIFLVFMLNIIESIRYFNFIYFCLVVTYFIVRMLILTFKKDYLYKTNIFNMKYIFDLYSYMYLIIILIKLLNVEI